MIKLFVDKGVAYVWNAEDWQTLRSNHRVCGALIGSIPTFPRQNDFLGLPMALMSEEAALLVEKGICELYEVPHLSQEPTKSDKENTKTIEKRVLKEQTDALRKCRIGQLSQKIDVIVAGKRQKMLSLGVTDESLDKQALLQEEINKLPSLTPGHVLVHLPTQHHIDLEKQKASIELLIPSVTIGDGAMKFAIFCDLWEKGHYITSGSKFGSDYLLYPGDPVRFHAMYMVRCIYNNKISIQSTNLVAFGRLSVAVNKLAVLAFFSNHGQLQYQTLQWHDNVS